MPPLACIRARSAPTSPTFSAASYRWTALAVTPRTRSAQHLHWDLRPHQERPLCGPDRLQRRRPDVLQQHRPEGDAVEQHRLAAARQVQVGTCDRSTAATDGIKQANPSDDYLNGFKTIGGWNVPATIPSTIPGAAKLFPTQWTIYNAYTINRIAPYFWLGAKYAISSQLDVTGAFYYLAQNNYNSSTTPAPPPIPPMSSQTGVQFTLHRQQRLLRRLDRLPFLPDRLPAGQARRSLCRRDDLERVRRPRERLPGDPDDQPDRRPAHQVLIED